MAEDSTRRGKWFEGRLPGQLFDDLLKGLRNGASELWGPFAGGFDRFSPRGLEGPDGGWVVRLAFRFSDGTEAEDFGPVPASESVDTVRERCATDADWLSNRLRSFRRPDGSARTLDELEAEPTVERYAPTYEDRQAVVGKWVLREDLRGDPRPWMGWLWRLSAAPRLRAGRVEDPWQSWTTGTEYGPSGRAIVFTFLIGPPISPGVGESWLYEARVVLQPVGFNLYGLEPSMRKAVVEQAIDGLLGDRTTWERMFREGSLANEAAVMAERLAWRSQPGFGGGYEPEWEEAVRSVREERVARLGGGGCSAKATGGGASVVEAAATIVGAVLDVLSGHRERARRGRGGRALPDGMFFGFPSGSRDVDSSSLAMEKFYPELSQGRIAGCSEHTFLETFHDVQPWAGKGAEWFPAVRVELRCRLIGKPWPVIDDEAGLVQVWRHRLVVEGHVRLIRLDRVLPEVLSSDAESHLIQAVRCNLTSVREELVAKLAKPVCGIVSWRFSGCPAEPTALTGTDDSATGVGEGESGGRTPRSGRLSRRLCRPSPGSVIRVRHEADGSMALWLSSSPARVATVKCGTMGFKLALLVVGKIVTATRTGRNKPEAVTLGEFTNAVGPVSCNDPDALGRARSAVRDLGRKLWEKAGVPRGLLSPRFRVGDDNPGSVAVEIAPVKAEPVEDCGGACGVIVYDDSIETLTLDGTHHAVRPAKVAPKSSDFSTGSRRTRDG